MMLKGMEGLVFGIHVDHGEGRLYFPDPALRDQILEQAVNAACLMSMMMESRPKTYPFNPNGSLKGSPGSVRRTAGTWRLMPHPERVFLPWQAHWLPEEMKYLQVSPWMRMFQNAYDWCASRL